MADWKPIKDAPKDGRPVLLWARLKTAPAGRAAGYPIVGFWHDIISEWRVAPEHLSDEALIATYWNERSFCPLNSRNIPKSISSC
jgi:hypothetical protein